MMLNDKVCSFNKLSNLIILRWSTMSISLFVLLYKQILVFFVRRRLWIISKFLSKLDDHRVSVRDREEHAKRIRRLNLHVEIRPLVSSRSGVAHGPFWWSFSAHVLPESCRFPPPSLPVSINCRASRASGLRYRWSGPMSRWCVQRAENNEKKTLQPPSGEKFLIRKRSIMSETGNN